MTGILVRRPELYIISTSVLYCSLKKANAMSIEKCYIDMIFAMTTIYRKLGFIILYLFFLSNDVYVRSYFQLASSKRTSDTRAEHD